MRVIWQTMYIINSVSPTLTHEETITERYHTHGDVRLAEWYEQTGQAG